MQHTVVPLISVMKFSKDGGLYIYNKQTSISSEYFIKKGNNGPYIET